jgi:hypothetical protein
MVTKVRTGDSTGELVVVEDSVDDRVEVANVGSTEKEIVETSAIVEMDVLVVGEGVDEVGTFVDLESLGVVNEAAAASTVGFG